MKYKCDTECSDLEFDQQKAIKFNSDHNEITSSKNSITTCPDDSNTEKEDNGKLQNNKNNNSISKGKNKDFNYSPISNPKQLPTVFFIIFIVVLANATYFFAPPFYNLAKSSNLYVNRFNIKTFSEYFSSMHVSFKSLNLFSLMILSSIIFTLTSLIRQRISVPELKNQKFKNILVILSCIISIFTMVLLIVAFPQTKKFSKNYFKICDNIIFPVFMLFSLLFCYILKNLIEKLNIPNIPHDEGYLSLKSHLISVMFVQLLFYVFSLLLSSYYEPTISIEQLLSSILIICYNINSFIFLIAFSIYIYTLRYDLNYMIINLSTRRDLEYFVDFEEKFKMLDC